MIYQLSAQRRTQGFTLIEVMISTAILGVIFSFLAVVMVSASRELNTTMPESGLAGEMDYAIGRVVDELQDASAMQVTVANDGSWISFAVPINIAASWEGTPEAGPTFSPDWGSRLGWDELLGKPRESSGGFNVIVFQKAGDVDEATIVPGGLNVNMNTEPVGQRDAADVFARGHLLFVYDPNGSYGPPAPVFDGDETSRQITGDWVTQVEGGGDTFGLDVDGAGAAGDPDGHTGDHIFRFDGTRVDVNLWGLRVVRSQRTAFFMNRRASVILTNP